MPLISFSIDEMKPMILAGLRQCDVAMSDEHKAQAKQHLDKPHSRIKRQTIRAFNYKNTLTRSPWRHIDQGKTLNMWWQSRTKEREFIGLAKCKGVRFIEMQNIDGTIRAKWIERKYINIGSGATFMDGQGIAHQDIRELAFKDGFASLDDFTAYFVPKVGDVFRGVVIRW